MPNNLMTSAITISYARGGACTRIYIYVTVAYDTDLSLAKELTIKAAKMHPHVINDHTCSSPDTKLTNFLDSGIEYRLACYVDDYDMSAHYAGQIRETIYKLVRDNNIEISYNRLEVDLLDCDGKRRFGDDALADRALLQNPQNAKRFPTFPILNPWIPSSPPRVPIIYITSKDASTMVENMRGFYGRQS